MSVQGGTGTAAAAGADGPSRRGAADMAPIPATAAPGPAFSAPMAPTPTVGARPAAADLTRTLFAVLFIGGLLGASLWTLQPFIGPAIWAVMVVVATWPLLLRAQALLGGRRWAAVTVMTLALLLLFVVPLTAVVGTLIASADQIAAAVRLLTEFRLPDAPPRWLAELPLVGSAVRAAWQQATELGIPDLLKRLQPYAGGATRWFLAEVGSLGMLIVQFLLTVVIAAVFYANGETAADLVRRFARRLAGERGLEAVVLTGGSIRGVALGVGVTAILQAVLGGLGLWAARVPFAGLATALMFMFCLAQIGPIPVLLVAAVWAFWVGHTGWGIALVVWALFVGTVDNFIRPVLIRMGAEMSLLLIFAGVIGGLVAFGLVGIFVGPVLLAVGWTLLKAWMDDGDVLPA